MSNLFGQSEASNSMPSEQPAGHQSVRSPFGFLLKSKGIAILGTIVIPVIIALISWLWPATHSAPPSTPPALPLPTEYLVLFLDKTTLQPYTACYALTSDGKRKIRPDATGRSSIPAPYIGTSVTLFFDQSSAPYQTFYIQLDEANRVVLLIDVSQLKISTSPQAPQEAE